MAEAPESVTDVLESLTDIPESVTKQLLGDLVLAFRHELSHWIPVLLTPLVEELKDLRSRAPESSPASGRAAQSLDEPAASASVEDKMSLAPSLASRGLGCQDVMVDQESRKDLSSATIDSSPVEQGFEMSAPLVDADGPPREDLFVWSWRHMWGSKEPTARGAYPRCENPEEPVRYTHIMDADMTDDDSQDLMDAEAAKRLPEEIASLETKVAAAIEYLNDLDVLYKNRRMPCEKDIANAHMEIEKLQQELEWASKPKGAPPPGPVTLKFVDSEAFAVFCNLVVLLNGIAMIVGPHFKSYAGAFLALDHVFLVWYTTELCAKALYYQHSFLFGKASFVCWNWLDLSIVVGGVIDQWLLPILTAMNGRGTNINVSAFRMLRLLRHFRLMRLLRFLKLVKAFLHSDFAWTEGAAFESWMFAVIAFNSVAISIELDMPWSGWIYVENFLQIVYTFELACRLKRQRCNFFIDVDNMVWNYLDCLMVVGGALDLWLEPVIDTRHHSASLSGALKILKIMRILRVLRLVRLLKVVKPLYRLGIGVIASVKAMQWVLVLTFLTLYAFSIVFTNLVGKGLMSSGEVGGSAFEHFGCVPRSLFSLFKLMNGDISVVHPITSYVTGQLLFVSFMVTSKWAILAILTAVVSDNMISTSRKANEEEEQKQSEIDNASRARRLTAIFKEIDRDDSGTISTTEWMSILEDRSLQWELCAASGLSQEDLNDYFDCLAKDARQQKRERLRNTARMKDLSLDYQSFMAALKDEGTLADKKSILHVMKQLRFLESQVEKEFEALGTQNMQNMQN